jgi:hypothetical protein
MDQLKAHIMLVLLSLLDLELVECTCSYEFLKRACVGISGHFSRRLLLNVLLPLYCTYCTYADWVC